MNDFEKLQHLYALLKEVAGDRSFSCSMNLSSWAEGVTKYDMCILEHPGEGLSCPFYTYEKCLEAIEAYKGRRA